MSIRPSPPPSSPRWIFFSGSALLMLVALFFIVTSASPPGIVTIIVALVCAGGGIVLSIAPYLMEYETRLRMAESAARDVAEVQARKLAQTADQLAQAVSRSQSTEEQAGHALGTIEDVAERLTAQVEELSQALARSAEREQAALKAEIDRVVLERDEKLDALEKQIVAVVASLAEMQATVRKSGSGATRAIEDVVARLDELGAKIESLRDAPREPSVVAPTGSSVAPAPTPAASGSDEPPSPGTLNTADGVVAPDASVSSGAEDDSGNGSAVHESTSAGVGASVLAEVKSVVTPAAPSRPARTRQRHTVPPESLEEIVVTERPAHPTTMDLPLEGMPEPRPPARISKRDTAGATSLVATAYIGIGNKLFVRGDGPGLSWDKGVPMQFVAIGKWGWTATDGSAPVTCRVYRNDDTPMLDENIVIEPGGKAEIAPRF